MKTFLMTFDESGKPKFVDKKDKATFELLLSSYNERGLKFNMTISDLIKKTNENQMKLWNTLVSLIANETGNDFSTIEETLLQKFNKKTELPNTMSNEIFQNLLMSSTVFVQDLLGLNIEYVNDKFQIKKI